eukprot:87006-Prorocentrum_minimum.AAC.1
MATSTTGEREEAASSVSSPPLQERKRRTLCLAVDDSTVSDGCAAWVAKHVLQPGDLVHIVMAVPPAADPTITIAGARGSRRWWQHAVTADPGRWEAGIEAPATRPTDVRLVVVSCADADISSWSSNISGMRVVCVMHVM